MFGALIGDFVGSSYEFHPIYSKYFDLFATNYTLTDDSVLTASISQSFMYEEDIRKNLVQWTLRHNRAGYGKNYFEWALQQKEELNEEIGNSWGNGCLMRNSPCVLLSKNTEKALELSRMHTQITHNNEESLRATQLYTKWCSKTLEFAVQQNNKKNSFIPKNEKTLVQERKNFFFNLVHEDTIVFDKLEEYCMTGFKVDATSTLLRVLSILWQADSFEEMLRNAVYIGGDSDTNAAIAGCAGEIIFGFTPAFLKDFLAYAHFAGEVAPAALPVVACSYLYSPHKDYFLEHRGYLPIITEILEHDKKRQDKLKANE